MLQKAVFSKEQVGFSRLETTENKKNMGLISDSTDGVLGVSYEDGAQKWKKKTMIARFLSAILTVICTTLIVILLLTYELQWNCPTCAATGGSNNQSNSSLEGSVKFLVASDLHYDAYYDEMIGDKPTYCRRLGNFTLASYKAHYGRIGCDSPGLLIDSMLNGMKAVYDKNNPEFFLFTGDFSAHKTDATYFVNGTTPERVLNNINTSAHKIHNTFPNIPVFPVLGNNDLEGHYVLPHTDNDQWLNETLNLFAPMILCNSCPASTPKPTTMEELQSTFLIGGYYRANISDGRLVLLALNSMYWNVYSNEKSGDIHVQAMKQMNWLEQQLHLAKQQGKKVLIASHIPPGIDPWGDKGTPFWLANYTSLYVDLVARQYTDIVAGQFYAHIHKADYKLQMTDTQPIEDHLVPADMSFAMLMPAISVVYANNPAFRQFYLDPVKQVLLDFDQYYMDIVLATEYKNPQWQFDYRFSQRFPSKIQHLNAERVYELNQNLINQSHETTWTSYAFSRTINYQPGSYSRFGLYCSMRHAKTSDYQKCMARYEVRGG